MNTLVVAKPTSVLLVVWFIRKCGRLIFACAVRIKLLCLEQNFWRA